MSSRRSRLGCLTCRARKIRCEDSRSEGPCGRCARLGLQCRQSQDESISERDRENLIATSQAQNGLNQAGLKRIRTTQSCASCRTRRQKCSGERPSCQRCWKAGRTCEYAGPQRSGVDLINDIPSINSRGIEATSSAPTHDFKHVSRDLVKSLAETFFTQVAPLRCFGFIHQPSFMHRIDDIIDHEASDPLLRAICALATKCDSSSPLRDSGNKWAEEALQMVFQKVDQMSVKLLMSIVLLHEHSARIDRLGLCFILSSTAARYTQALQLNVEFDLDFDCKESKLSITEKETRRRLMWACYMIDSATACGVDQLKLLREEDLTIRLPANDESFRYRQSEGNTSLPRLGTSQASLSLQSCAGARKGHRAFHVELSAFRERALRFLKRMRREGAEMDTQAEFNLLASDLSAWKAALPRNLELDPEVLFIRKSEHMLSAIVSLHIAYHQFACDLYRIMTPEIPFSSQTQNDLLRSMTSEFKADACRLWFEHGKSLTGVFRVALDNDPVSMEDPEVAISAFTAIRVKLFSFRHIPPSPGRALESNQVDEMILTDLKFLRRLTELHPSAGRTLAAAERMVSASSAPAFVDGLSLERGDIVPDIPLSMAQVSADNQLHPLATFRIVRDGISDKHAPETVLSPSVQQSQGGLAGANNVISDQYDFPDEFFWARSNTDTNIDEPGFPWMPSGVMPLPWMN